MSHDELQISFNAQIKQSEIECTIRSSQPLTNAVLCYSAIGPTIITQGGKVIENIANFVAAALPELKAGEPHMIRLRYADNGVKPLNSAWLPLRPYLRLPDELYLLPPSRSGVISGAHEHVTCDLDLWLCPQPKSFTKNACNIEFRGLNLKNRDPVLSSADRLANRAGFTPLFIENGTPLTLKKDAKILPEGYCAAITQESIKISYSDNAGLFYAMITLIIMRHTHHGMLPCGTINDNPQFEWRGQHLDCARHFVSVETILRLLDLMALLKLNRFHWHFADDEAFRIELASLPELAQSHFRGEGSLVPGVFGGIKNDGGSYTTSDVRRIVAHAKSLQIEVMPEIEVPAHSWALTQIYPNTRDHNDNSGEMSVQGYYENALNPAMDETWRLWHAMIDELVPLFPFEVFHLGGDELPARTWSKSPAAQSLMLEHNLENSQDLQGWTMHKLAHVLAQKGKTAGAWEEAAQGCQGGIGHDAVLFSWTGQTTGLEAAKSGYRVVMTPAQNTYLDMSQSLDVADWGAGWASHVRLVDTINWQPIPTSHPELAQNIIGVQGAFWSEFTTQDAQIETMIAPRILGIASIAWQNSKQNNELTLLKLAAVYEDVFTTIGWQFSGSVAAQVQD